jgi:hypothetical protein
MYHYFQNTVNISDFAFKAGVINGKLCFGPTSAPRVFTKIVSVVAAILRAQSIRVAIYLDDWLVVNQNKQHLILDREKCLNLLVSLGFIINNQKSCLVPSQKITY